MLGDTKCELGASPAGLTSKERELHNLLMQAEKHSIWPLTHSHPQIHSQKAESERKTGMLYSTCHGVKICYYTCASESQRSLSRAPDLPLSAHSLIPVIKPTSCSRCYRCYFTEASLSTNHESQSSKARAAFRHVDLIKNLTFPLFADGISPIFIKHGLSLLPSSLPQAAGRIRNDWHIGTFYHTYHHHHHPASHLPYPAHRQTDTHLGYITTYYTLHSR